MLTISPIATAALASLLESSDAPEGAVIRLMPAETVEGEPIAISVVADPGIDDQAIAPGGGVDVYVEPHTADALADKHLDLEVDEDPPAFVFRAQSWNGNGGPPDAAA